LSNLKIKTGLTPNILSRFAICLSLKDPSIPNPLEFDENGTEFLPETLFGEHQKMFLALMIDRLHRDGINPEEINKTKTTNLDVMLRAHLNRGVYSMISRIQGLSSFNEMIKAEQQYD
jgi:DNA sulfur modification protein DndE